MTSEQIKTAILNGTKAAGDHIDSMNVAGCESEVYQGALLRGSLALLAASVLEVAYQLAVMNERAAAADPPKKKSAGLEWPIVPVPPPVRWCSLCSELIGSQHKPSCDRQGVVSLESTL